MAMLVQHFWLVTAVKTQRNFSVILTYLSVRCNKVIALSNMKVYILVGHWILVFS